MSTVIGLAFGNTSTSIAFEKEGKAELIANQDGDRAIPTALSYVGSDEYHGIQAIHQLIRNPKNTAIAFRDYIGVPYDKVDPTYSHTAAHLVEEGGKTGFKIKNSDDEDVKFVSVDEIAVRHLARIGESAKDFIGKDIDGVVIALPTDYSEERKQAVVDVAKKAGLNVLQVINEPTAALLAHVAARNDNSDKLFVVADFGGTRSDGAVIAARGGMFTILATAHDYELGGSKIDDSLVEYVAKEFEKQHGINCRDEPRAIAKLKAEAEVAKKTLSNTTSSNFAIEGLSNGIDFNTTINRLRLELVARPQYNGFVSFVEKLLSKAQVDVLDVDEVLLVGGTSFSPKIASSLAGVFSQKTNIVAPGLDPKAIAPNELIAKGAAIQASLLAGYDADDIKEYLQAVVAVVPNTVKPLGLIDNDGKFVSILEAFTPIPIRKTQKFIAKTSNVLVKLVEATEEIEARKLEKPVKEETTKAEGDEDESDWSEDEEDEEVREKVYKPTKDIAELALKGVQVGSSIEVIVNISADQKVKLAAREVRASAKA